MFKFKIELEVETRGELPIENPQIPMSASHRNALMREAVWLQISDALHQYGLEPHNILSVVKVRGKDKK